MLTATSVRLFWNHALLVSERSELQTIHEWSSCRTGYPSKLSSVWAISPGYFSFWAPNKWMNPLEQLLGWQSFLSCFSTPLVIPSGNKHGNEKSPLKVVHFTSSKRWVSLTIFCFQGWISSFRRPLRLQRICFHRSKITQIPRFQMASVPNLPPQCICKTWSRFTWKGHPKPQFSGLKTPR